MFVGTITRGKRIDGFIATGLVEVHSISQRHEQLAAEMMRRGFRHQSPLPDFRGYAAGKVSARKNLQELSNRCPDCRARIAAG